jgi:hypothetical protein
MRISGVSAFLRRVFPSGEVVPAIVYSFWLILLFLLLGLVSTTVAEP